MGYLFVNFVSRIEEFRIWKIPDSKFHYIRGTCNHFKIKEKKFKKTNSILFPKFNCSQF